MLSRRGMRAVRGCSQFHGGLKAASRHSPLTGYLLVVGAPLVVVGKCRRFQRYDLRRLVYTSMCRLFNNAIPVYIHIYNIYLHLAAVILM